MSVLARAMPVAQGAPVGKGGTLGGGAGGTSGRPISGFLRLGVRTSCFGRAPTVFDLPSIYSGAGTGALATPGALRRVERERVGTAPDEDPE